MSNRRQSTVDANEAVASVAYRGHEVIAIYPITPASPMGELADAWAAEGRPNLWGTPPEVVAMQSEGGAAGTLHGALQGGALSTTFTASQGLLLMLPNMYKIAGELTSCVMHVAARTLATHALSIFGDHSDVMSARGTGFAMLASGSAQEAQDLAAIAHAATLTSRIPFLHFFDGFRTSHEISKITVLEDDELRSLLDASGIEAHRRRGLTPDRPRIRGTAQNPDTFFQAREAASPYYEAGPEIVENCMARFAQLTGRAYRLFDYHGHPEAEQVIVIMGSGAEAVHETVDWLNRRGERTGALKVRLFRPWSSDHLLAALPSTVVSMAVLDRCKEPGASGDPLYLDVVATLAQAQQAGTLPWPEMPRVVAGRYGLSSKEFDPSCVRAVFEHLSAASARAHRNGTGFTVGIRDDISHSSLPLDPTVDIEADDVQRAVFYGLGSDGTVSANKSTIKIIGRHTELQVQAYFVYDSKKAGAVTVSHLRFAPRPIRSTYLIQRANFVACHQFHLLERHDVLERAAPGAIFLLNAPYPAATVWQRLPRETQQQILDKDLRFHVIDAYGLARQLGLGGRINTIMQTCFFALTGVLPLAAAQEKICHAIDANYGKRGPEVVRRNRRAVAMAVERLQVIETSGSTAGGSPRPPTVPAEAPDLVRRVSAMMLAGKGDLLPVSAFPTDGTWPTATSRWEKRNIALEVPIWDTDLCIQCNQCALACPHAAIRPKVYEPKLLDDAPEGFRSTPYRAPDLRGLAYTLQVAPEDCTGCHLCVEVCPAKDKANPRRKAIAMQPLAEVRQQERRSFDFFLQLPEIDRQRLPRLDAKGSQLLQPLFEFSGACGGCGETPYIKLLTQLFGDRLLIANATGCSSIYGGNLPTTPYATDAADRGPAWSNSLFEDNAEFGLGFRLALDRHVARARSLLLELAAGLDGDLNGNLESDLDSGLAAGLAAALDGDGPYDETELSAQRRRLERLDQWLVDGGAEGDGVGRLRATLAYLLPKSLWLVGGDGWAYDIGYGGLDHVLASGRDVNVLVLDTEVYSNTGGQASKATPLGAAAKFAAAGKDSPKKDLGMEMMTYGHVYVAQIAFGAHMNQTVQALREAAAYAGPSLVIAYSPCIAHGYDLRHGAVQQRRAVSSGAWPLYRFDPRRAAVGKPPLHLDCKPPNTSMAEYMRAEARFRMVEKQDPQRFKHLLRRAQMQAERRWDVYRQLAGITLGPPETTPTDRVTTTQPGGEQ